MAIDLNFPISDDDINAIAALPNDIRIDLTQHINSTHPFSIFEPVEGKKNQIICPFCGSGSGKHHTGVIFTFENEKWLYHCFACNNFSGDLIKIIADANHFSTKGKDFFHVLAIAVKILNINIATVADETPVIKTITVQKKKPAVKVPATEYPRLAEARNNLSSFVESQGGEWRGLPLALLKQLSWGFLPIFSHPKSPNFTFPAIIVPNDLNGIFARRVNDKGYSNIEPTATTTIFLPDADSFDVIITEGAINGASILAAISEPNFGIIASGGTSGNSNVLARLQQLKSQGKNFRVLIAYDNDTSNAGQIAAAKLLKMLISAGFTACTIDIIKQGDVDLNDVLRANNGVSRLADMVNSAISDAQETFNNNENIAINYFDLADITDKNQSKPNEDFISAADDEDLAGLKIPDNYKISKNGSIVKISVSVDENGKKHTQQKSICPRKLFIKEKLFNIEEKTFKQILAYSTVDGKLKTIPAQETSTIFNKNKLVELTNYSQLFTSTNARSIVDWLFAFNIANETKIPITYTVNHCGWYENNDQIYFVDPRRENQIEDDGKKFNLTVDPAKCQLANSLISKGNIDEWRKAYLLAKPSTIARATIAASVAAPLLKLLNERNFVFYVHGKTTGGKSTALFLGSSAVGRKDLVRIFDGSTTALNALAAETNHLPLFIDEKQSADQKLKADFARWIYNDANGTEKQRANKDGTARTVREWLHITLANGETELLNDNTTGGAFTRLLQIAAPSTILDADTCKIIRDIIKNNYGLAWTPYIDLICKTPIEEIQEMFNSQIKIFDDIYPNILPEYRRYIALIYVADELLNKSIDTFDNCNALEYDQIFNAIPTKEEIDDTAREKNAVNTFIVTKATHFDGNTSRDPKAELFGRYSERTGYLYIIKAVLDKHLQENGYDAKKIANDLVADGFFKPADKIAKDCKSPRPVILAKFDGNPIWCYRVPLQLIDKKTQQPN